METRTLPVKLTEEELAQRRDKLAELVRDHTLAEQKKKDEASKHKTIVDKLEECMSAVAREIREKSQYIPVQVSKEVDQGEGVENTIRMDTGEVIATRQLTPQEKQVKLFDVPDGKAAVAG